MLKEKSKNLLAGMLMFLMVTKFYIVYFEFASVSKFLMLFSLVLSTILIIDNRKSYNWVHLAFFGLAGIQFFMSKNITVFYTYYICLGLAAVDFRKLAKVFVVINCIYFALFLVSNLMGIHPTEYIEARNDFGFGNPNSAFICMYLIWSAFYYLIFDSNRKSDYILMFSMVFLMYTQTTTRTGLLTAIMTIIAYAILKQADLSKRIHRIFIASFPIFMSVLSLVMGTVLSSSYFLNKVLSHRPLYWSLYLLNPSHGINLFGYAANIRDILFTQRTPLDSGYIWTLYSHGIIVYFALIAMMTWALYYLCKENKKDQILLIVSLLIYCFAESIMIDAATNIGLILVVQTLTHLDIKNIGNRRKGKIS